jgi:hypothetical protein
MRLRLRVVTIHVIQVLLQQDISKFSTGAVRRGDIVIPGFQPLDDLFGSALIRLPALSVKVGQYLRQTINTDLGTIRKSHHAPTNCRRLAVASGYSSYHFKMWHNLSSLGLLSARHAGSVLPHVGDTGGIAASILAFVLDRTSWSWALTFPAETAMTTAWTAPISSSEIPMSLATPR